MLAGNVTGRGLSGNRHAGEEKRAVGNFFPPFHILLRMRSQCTVTDEISMYIECDER